MKKPNVARKFIYSLSLGLMLSASLATAQYYNILGFWKAQASAPKTIYRSVGPGNTNALACGVTAGSCTGQGNFSISGTTATFVSALPLNVGVGDAVQYQVAATWYIAFISGVQSSTVFNVQSASGATPTAATAINAWSVYRAYTSINSALTGSGQQNTSINAAVRNFDTWSNGYNLVSNNRVWNIAVYADALDTSSVSVQSAWITGATNYLRIYAPYLSTEVGVTQRHIGVWDNTKARVQANSVDVIQILSNYVHVEGLQISSINGAATTGNGIGVYLTTAPSAIYIQGNIIKSDNNGNNVIGISDENAVAGDTIYVNNNIIYGWTSGSGAAAVSTGIATFYIYNNTMYNNDGAVFSWLGNNHGITMKNNIAQGCTMTCYSHSGGQWNLASDYNISADTTMPGGTHDKINQIVLFSSLAGFDYRISGQDTSAKAAGVNLSADGSLAFNNDIANFTRTATWDIGASMPAATMIFRSVGPGNNSPLANGAYYLGPGIFSGQPNAMTITGNVASFNFPMPGNIGVGDVIQYNSSPLKIAFITGRLDSLTYTLQSASGGMPFAVSGDQTWIIYRAYTSLANAIDQTSGGTENTAINAAVRNFDTWTGNYDLTAAKQQLNIALYADAADTGKIKIYGWNDSANYFIRLFTPYLPTEVGTSQRHNGYWSNTAGRIINMSPNNRIIDATYMSYMQVDGLQIQYLVDVGGDDGLDFQGTVGASNLIFSNSIINPIGPNAGSMAFYVFSGKAAVYNNLIYCTGGGSNYAFYSNLATGSLVEFYNNTAVNCGTGFSSSVTGSAIFYGKNNISSGNTTADFAGSFAPSSDYNVAHDATSTGGSHDKISQTIAFNNSATKDYRLASTDTSAKGAGKDLSADPYLAFSTDNQGKSRSAPWDAGASEAVPINILWVQSSENTTTFSSSITTNIFSSPVNAGDLIVCLVEYDVGWNPVQFVMDMNGSYFYPTVGAVSTPGAWNQEVWYLPSISASSLQGGYQVIAAMLGTSNNLNISCHEYSGAGIWPADTWIYNTNNSTNPNSSASATTAFVNELLFGVATDDAGAVTSGASFTSRSVANNDNVEDKMVHATGAYSAPFVNATSGNWAAQLTTFTTSNVTPCGPIQRVQEVPGINGGGLANALTQQRTIDNNQGDLLVAIAYAGQGPGMRFPESTTANMIFTVTDTNGNTYYPGPLIDDQNDNQAAIQIFYAQNIAGGLNTVTVTSSNLPSYTSPTTGLWLAEYSGMATTLVADVSSGTYASSGYYGPLASPSMTTTTACDLVVSGFAQGYVGGENTLVPPGWRLANMDLNDPAGYIDNLPLGSASGSSVAAKFFIANQYEGWAATQMAFRAANTSAPPQPTKIAFAAGPQTVNTYACNAITIKTENAGGAATPTSTGAYLTVSGAGASYFADSACQFPVSAGLLIGAGSSSQTFYFMATTTGSPTISVASTGFTTINQTETVNNNNPYLWIGGGGCSGNWNVGGTANVCWKGGFDPGAGNVAEFDNSVCITNCNPTLVANLTVGGIWMHPTYSGTINQSTFNVTTTNFELDSGTWNNTSGNLIVSSKMILTGGTFNAGSGQVTPTYFDSSTGSPTLNPGTGKFTFGSNSLVNSGTIAFNDVYFTTGSWATTTIAPPSIYVNGNLFFNMQANASLNAPLSNIYLQGNLNINANPISGSLSIIDFQGSGNQTYTTAGGALPSSIVFDISKTGGTFKLNSDLVLSGSSNFLVFQGLADLNGHNIVGNSTTTVDIDAAGTLNGSSGTITLGNGWYGNGTFNSGTSTVVFTGSFSNINGSTSFNNLTYSNAGGASLGITAGATNTVTGTLTLTGTGPGNLLTIQSLTAGTQTLLNATGAKVTSYLNLTDVKAVTPISIGGPAGSSVNGGNDSGWTFP